MSTESVNTPVESNIETSDLDSFAADLFGQKEAAPEPASSEETTEEVVDRDVTETENTDEAQETTDEDNESDEVDAEEPEEEEDKPKAKPKNRAQERISELNTKWREEQRKREALEAQLAALQNPVKNTEPTAPVASGEPDPTALKEDGTPKYPMGEFDKEYLKDLTKFQLNAALEEQRKQAEQLQARTQQEVQQQAIVEAWNEKLTPALDRYPDFQEKAEELLTGLSGLDSDYEDYIANTIMQMDYGPDVLYYLSENPSEARAIVDSGPTKAAIALGRLEAKFAQAEAEKTLARPKVSKAPTPPPRAKGSAVAKTSVAPDTDDLEAFSREFVKKVKY